MYAGPASLITQYIYDHGIVRECIYQDSNKYGCIQSKYYTTWDMKDIVQATTIDRYCHLVMV